MTVPPTEPERLRRPYRPPIGIPLPRQHKAGSAVAAVIFHALIFFLLLGPVIAHDLMVAENEGAGGKGPSGGGGGGRRGVIPERATYVEMAPPPAQQRVAPPVPRAVPPPVVKPPQPQLQLSLADPLAIKPVALPAAALSGAGTGSDGSGGTGPGTGGGVGSGEGTGRGSGNGPGTGGGAGRVYPPSVTNLALLPLPVPARVRPYTMTAVFEVDERGNAKLLHFNESRDSDYNKRIRAMLAEVRFRPAVRADGTPVKDTTSIVASAPL